MKKIVAIAGALLLVAGCFLPIITAPTRTFNFFDPVPVNIPDMPQNALLYTGIGLIAIAVVAITLSLIGRTKLVWLGGLLSASILAGVYFGFHSKIDELKTQADKQVGDLFGGLFKGVTDSLFEAIELKGPGWYVLGAGVLLLITSAFIKNNNKSIVQS